jgi:hypothetical protein
MHGTSMAHVPSSSNYTPQNEQRGIIAILFDADHPSLGCDYGSTIENAFLGAFAKLDQSRGHATTVLRGDVLARNLASTVTRVVVPTNDSKLRSRTVHSRQMGTDIHKLATVIGDLSDSLASLWQTLDLIALPSRLAGSNVYCLTIFPMKVEVARQLDEKLSGFDSYLGALEVDSGNPIQMRVFSQLLRCVYFSNGTMYASRWDTDEDVYTFGSTADRYFKIEELSYWDYQKFAPALPKAPLSTRGKQSLKRFSSIAKPSSFERVADAIFEQSWSSQNSLPIDFNLRRPDEQQLEIPVSKLLKYVLNTEHPTGKHKAKLFSELLGIHADQWRFLAYQIYDCLPDTEFAAVRVTEHGIQFGACLQLIGLNGQTCTVETGWIIRPNEPAQLVTAFPAEKNKQRNLTASCPPWIPAELPPVDRWKMLYSLAHKNATKAAIDCVPTPIQIEGFRAELEGNCGGASIRLDGRTSFARWLIAQKLGSRGYGSGVQVWAKSTTQSADRANAYADAFALVIWLNGVDGVRIERYLS